MRESIQFYLDHNVHKDTATLLRMRGHEAFSALEIGTDAAKDDAHLLIAVHRRAMLVTHNRKEFELLSDAWKRWTQAWQLDQPRHGILVLPQPLLPFQIADVLERFLSEGHTGVNHLYE